MSNPGSVNSGTGGVSGLSGTSPVSEKKSLKGQWLSSTVGKLDSAGTKLPAAYNRSLSVPETSIHSRVSSPGSSDFEISGSCHDQVRYILNRPTTLETHHKVIEHFVNSMSVNEKIALWEKQGLDPEKVAYIKVLIGEGVDVRAAKLLGSGKKDKTYLKKTEEFNQTLIKTLNGLDPSSLGKILGQVNVSEASMKMFLISIAAGFGSNELKGWNGVPGQSPVVTVPESLGHDPLAISVSVKPSGKTGRELSINEVNSLASTTTLRTLEEKQKQNPSVEALTELSVDQQSLLQDSNRMLMTFEVCDPQQQHTSVLFDSRRLPSTAATSDADVAGRERRKELLEEAFASTIDGSQNGLTVFRALSHQGPLNELVTKLYPLLPKGPTMQQGAGVQDGSEVRFVLSDPEHMTVISTNKYDRFSDRFGKKEEGEGQLRLKLQLEKREDTWRCRHADIQYTDSVNKDLKSAPVVAPDTPTSRRKHQTAHKRSMSDSGLKTMAAATNRPDREVEAVKIGENNWLMASPAAAQFVQMIEEKRPAVQNNIKIFEEKWQESLAAADGSKVEGRLQAGEVEAARARGVDPEHMKYQAQMRGLQQSLRQSAQLDKTRTGLNIIKSDVLEGSHYKSQKDNKEYPVTDNEFKQLFKSELEQYKSIREKYHAKAFEAYEAFCRNESAEYDIGRQGYTHDEINILDKLVKLYKGSYDWHVAQVGEMKARRDDFAASGHQDKGWIQAELKTLEKLEKESEMLIRSFRELGSEGSELKKKINFDAVRQAEFSELTSRTLVHQRAFFTLLTEYKINLTDQLEVLEPGAESHRVEDDRRVMSEQNPADSGKLVERARVSNTPRGRILSDTDNDFLEGPTNTAL